MSIAQMAMLASLATCVISGLLSYLVASITTRRMITQNKRHNYLNDLDKYIEYATNTIDLFLGINAAIQICPTEKDESDSHHSSTSNLIDNCNTKLLNMNSHINQHLRFFPVNHHDKWNKLFNYIAQTIFKAKEQNFIDSHAKEYIRNELMPLLKVFENGKYNACNIALQNTYLDMEDIYSKDSKTWTKKQKK
jgi:hypothetical protein